MRIKTLGVTQDNSPTRWKATGYVEGIGWLEAWGTSLIDAMEALQALAAQRVAEAEAEEHEAGEPPRHRRVTRDVTRG